MKTVIMRDNEVFGMLPCYVGDEVRDIHTGLIGTVYHVDITTSGVDVWVRLSRGNVMCYRGMPMIPNLEIVNKQEVQ